MLTKRMEQLEILEVEDKIALKFEELTFNER